MVTLSDALMDLVNQGLVEPKEAYMKAIDKQNFANALKAAGHDTGFLDIEAAVGGAEPPAGKPTPSAGSMAARRSGATAGR
jgi:hypothetical protein